MFKKPPADLKTSAPLRSSDRRKLKQRVVAEFSAPPETGDVLVPEGLLSQKFVTHIGEPGVVYLSPEGDPLWFSVGKGSDALIPTVYTLWKEPDLLPFLSTPEAVVPKLIGGADLMIPGVVQHSASLHKGQLVAVTQYQRDGRLGYPIAVGHTAVSSTILKQADEQDLKGKAVLTLHAWRDSLWEMGASKKADVPEPRTIPMAASDNNNESPQDAETEVDESKSRNGVEEYSQTQKAGNNAAEAANEQTVRPQSTGDSTSSIPVMTLGPEDVSSCLRSALLQAISASLTGVPPSTFPIPASLFWTNYVLPARPAQALGPNGLTDTSSIDIKQSTYKSVKTFLKACAKEGLIKLKESKGDVVVTGVFSAHPEVTSRRPHRTIQSVEAKREKAEERERKEKEEEDKKKSEIQVCELWKPFGPTLGWFVSAEKDTSHLYSISEIGDIFNKYITDKSLINVHDPQYINIQDDEALAGAVSIKNEQVVEFMKRDDALKRLREGMQNWYEVKTEANGLVQKKGKVKPISVVTKMRQGRKAATLITGFELFQLNADDLAEELKKVCASSTSVTPLHGKANELEIMVQGKQIKAVTDLLVARGVPKRWIEHSDFAKNKK